MGLYPGVSLIALGVADVSRARAFYERLGWRCSQAASTPQAAYFSLNNVTLGLFSKREAHAGAYPASRDAIRLAQNHGGAAAVDAALAEAVRAGAALIEAGAPRGNGSYQGRFADPDGHVWEIVWNPHVSLAPDGGLDLPP
ncbi:MAG: putative Glyoxalase/bleomycin resistance protein/dioxygenase [Hyphomicrobiales bacterium]|nr:putative Glyoxalase/bleomycin resistance protein/dioxygenase [Hyphomicrobiales bacterium]